MRSSAELTNCQPLHFGQQTNQHPRVKSFLVRHNKLVSIRMGARASADRLVAGTHWLSDECDVLLSYYELWLSQLNQSNSEIG